MQGFGHITACTDSRRLQGGWYNESGIVCRLNTLVKRWDLCAPPYKIRFLIFVIEYTQFVKYEIYHLIIMIVKYEVKPFRMHTN